VCGPDRDADLLDVVGQPRFGAVRGHALAPAKAFVEVLGTRFRTFVVREHNTRVRRLRCAAHQDACALRAILARAARWRNKHDKRRHSSEQNKDIIAARSMLIDVGTALRRCRAACAVAC
jgi:hypothetical protein